MTVSTTVRTAGPYVGVGSVSVYTFAFKVFLTTDVLVQITDTTGVLRIATLGTDYSVSLNADQDGSPGGSVIMTAPLASGYVMLIGSQVPLTQAIILTNPGGWYPTVMQAALDKLTILIQQALGSFGTTLRVPEVNGIAALPPASQRAGYVLGFDANGNPVTAISAATAAIGFVSEQQTGTGAKTVFTLTSITYTPGGSTLAVYLGGSRLIGGGVDFTETSSSVVTFTVAPPLNVEIVFVAGRLVNFASDGRQVSVQQIGTSTALRSVSTRAADNRTLNDYVGVDNTGVNDSSGGFINFQTDVQVVSFAQAVSGGRDVMNIDAGVYELSAQTFSHMQKIKGKGRKNTFIKLKPGETGSQFKFIAEDIAGTSLDDTNHCVVEGMTFLGNRTDGVTAGVSRAIECPDAPFPLSTQYGPSVQMRDVEIEGFTGSGIYLGVNRNWALMDEVIVRYCNVDALTSYGYDGRFTKCDFGQCLLGTGVNLQAGGGHDFSGCNIYGNLINSQVTAFVNSYVVFRGCAFDAALHDGLLVAAGAGPVTLLGGRFYSSGQAADNTYADIHTAGEVNVLGTQFLNGGTGKRPKFSLQTDGTSPNVLWLPGYIDVSGGAATPFTSFMTDQYPALRYLGSSEARWGSQGPATLSALIGNTEKVRIDNVNGFSTNNAALLISALTSLTSHNGAAAGTLTNAPVAGNPTKWIAINDGATTRYIPAW